MPNQTFFNLPEAKRERILAAATAELAQHSYHNASIASIVDGAGISRGSFYQYFADLMDLYKYIFEIAAEKKVQYLQHVMAEMHQLEVFDLIRELYTGAIRFAADHPQLAEMGNNFYKEDVALRQEILGDLGQKSNDFFMGLLQQGQAKGEIGPEVNLEVASMMFFTLNTALVDHFLEKKKQENLLDDLDGYLELVDEMLLIFKTGMAVNK